MNNIFFKRSPVIHMPIAKSNLKKKNSNHTINNIKDVWLYAYKSALAFSWYQHFMSKISMIIKSECASYIMSLEDPANLQQVLHV